MVSHCLGSKRLYLDMVRKNGIKKPPPKNNGNERKVKKDKKNLKKPQRRQKMSNKSKAVIIVSMWLALALMVIGTAFSNVKDAASLGAIIGIAITIATVKIARIDTL